MGNKSSRGGPGHTQLNHVSLSSQTHAKALEIFRQIDVDGSKTIDKNETIVWWNQNFAKVNTSALFETVDINNDGEISEEEWIAFWEAVKGSGRTEEEINEELDNLLSKGSWTNFNIPKLRR
jgi:Ca2+-binding EF-hand superfamily protein